MGENKIKMWFDDEVDTLYISLRKGVSVDSTEEEGVRVEYDKEGKVIGLEITEITRKLAEPLAKRLAELTK